MPNWIGDAVMATPALKNLQKHFPKANFYVITSSAVYGLFAYDPSIKKVFIDDSKKSFFRLSGISKLAAQIRTVTGIIDIGFTFQNNLPSALLLKKLEIKEIYGASVSLRDHLLTRAIKVDPKAHQAEIYNEIINGTLHTTYETGDPYLFVNNAKKSKTKKCGINAGGAYGSAKRWEAHKFAQVALELSQNYEIVIFGTQAEMDITRKIESVLMFNDVKNYKNLAGKTSVYELIAAISELSLFVTNDSGPMHIASAFKIPTVAIFGSTDHKQTHQWNNPQSVIIRRDIDCAPCKKRTCPQMHHKCMKDIQAWEVIEAARKLV